MNEDESRDRALEPLPETAQALRELARHGEVALGVELHAMAQRVRAVVPTLVGLSLSAVEDGLVLTVVSSAEQLAALDAVQYLDGGPCVAGVDRREVLDVAVDDLFDEDRWQLYAQASAALGVASSLSLPITDGDTVIGGVNLYASDDDSFDGRHVVVAEAVGADAAMAVRNADLSMRSLQSAAEAPARIRESGDVAIACGIISAHHDVDITVALERLRRAAARAGISEVQAAGVLRHLRAG